jgi:hypothetical protein
MRARPKLTHYPSSTSLLTQSTNSSKAAKLFSPKKPGREKDMSSEKKKEPRPVDNIISDETGQFDLRFVLWRHFCAQNSIPVETLPSQLDGEQKEKWEELKASRLRGQK